MELNIREKEIKKFLEDIKKRYIGEFVNKKISYDERAWQYDITDEFERRFVLYSKKDIEKEEFFKIGSFAIKDRIFIGLFFKGNEILRFIFECDEYDDFLKINNLYIESN